ncbi:hypothetical protein RZE82_02885 [Mollicutes bacterium LVI A0039]|nr:hypothetical protein RZE82_02885 [Mollicutes bacterium LVI A0039]
MINSYTPPKYNAVLTLLTFIGCFTIAAFTYLYDIETAPIILALAFIGSATIFFILHVNNLSMDISNSEVIIYKGKKETARYTRSQNNFNLVKRRYPGKKSPVIFLVVSNETEKKEYDISILGLKNFRRIAEDLECDAPDLIGNRIIS